MTDYVSVLTIIVPVWDRLRLIRACVRSIRQSTNVPYRLVLVDNGSGRRTANFLAAHADILIRHEHNLGYAGGINSALSRIEGSHVALVNSDVVLPQGWAETLIHDLTDERVGAVVPALTAAAVPRTVRDHPGTVASPLLPFEQPPSGAVLVMRREMFERLGGLAEQYGHAGAEDLDLAFTLWTNDLDVVFDERVLVHHVSKGTAGVKLPSWPRRWQEAGDAFLAHWADADNDVTWLGTCDQDRFLRNRRAAAAAAQWMTAYGHARRGDWPRLKEMVKRATAMLRAVRPGGLR